MENIERGLKNDLIKEWKSGKVLIVLGPRQVGKTTLINEVCAIKDKEHLFLNGDDPSIRTLLSDANEQQLKQIIGKHTTVFIDEAQRVKNIGLTAKIIHDRFKKVRLIISGSSALELANSINEPLTGRKFEHLLLPISWKEYSNDLGFLKAKMQLNQRLVFGMYPEVVRANDKARQVLQSLAGSYLYKDVLEHSGIRKPEILEKLLIALALQIGSEVNYNELANTLRIDRNTIENYISLLEKVFVIFRLNPLSRNVRSELNSGRKIYFYDNGIRNALLGDFKSIELRIDKGQLWQNFIVSERLKYNSYRKWYGHSYFWRTYQQQEIDLVEEIDGEFYAFECKWNASKKSKFSKTFLENYSPKESLVITPENFTDFLGIE
jgi:predicted AAA+ superfamily ATPase